MRKTMKTSEAPDPKKKILAAATALFAERGVAGASLRELTAKAGVNVAAVNYHFGSKERLEEAVFEDLAARINKQRLDSLKAVLKDAAVRKERPQLQSILETFVEPYLGGAEPGQGELLAQLILKHRLSPTELTTRLMRTHFDPMAKKYVAAFSSACPEIDAQEFVWRYMFMTSAVVLTATDRHKNNRVMTISSGKQSATDSSALRSTLMRFLVGGLAAGTLRIDP
jgi:AcrR family transcriptional regulator